MYGYAQKRSWKMRIIAVCKPAVLFQQAKTCIHFGGSQFRMNKPNVMRPCRFQLNRKGELTYQDRRFACLIQDISEKGIFIICNYNLGIGLELEVKFELEAGLHFNSKIRLRHIDGGCFGAEIIEVDHRSDSNRKRFLDSNYYGQAWLPGSRLQLEA
ncbi:MAG: PilZ domain-containing protein [Pseudomonadota bacterium]